MTVVSDDPIWWPIINWNIVFSYWTVAAGAVVVYDWVLTLGQEIELIWHGWQITLTPKCFRYVILDYHILSHSKYAIGLADRCRVSEILNISDVAQHNDSIGYEGDHTN
ncbi:hypothetical protein EV702DRAFT_1044653 [Suillus placidus]|uniref:DUF6533 domain-containing protein n=1 Tax=Suillus placidus TaxID=48579 RepID=A0A9P6ZYU3_9AGAM|nr:hypothetical protein EV702DRAFT_1044653 [Suillus placidus]